MTISPYIKSPLRSVQNMQKGKDRTVTFASSIKAHDNQNNITRTEKTSHSFRLVLLGEDGVGKSAISVRFLCGRYLHEYDPTLESCHEKLEMIDGRSTKIELYDTANQAPLIDYLAGADAILYVYSITDRSSFEKAQQLHSQLFLRGKAHIPVMLVGNKREMERGRCVSFKEGYTLARDSGWTFREVSAATDTGKLKDSVLEFIRDTQVEMKKVKTSRKGRYFRRAVSALSGHHSNNNSATNNTSKNTDTLSPLPEWSLNLLHMGALSPKMYQRRMTCPSI
ncbi:ras-like protein rasD [Strongylocentrotus purpuratus]|uniref:small monomeric GTPase n=1 Tax=Strongylocentrotus purpuratus TaxID=7668 RepID=A0A7M7N0Y1_STRPU|nr:ras-like protein rasD [Strongylocentrotus purpuratus]